MSVSTGVATEPAPPASDAPGERDGLYAALLVGGSAAAAVFAASVALVALLGHTERAEGVLYLLAFALVPFSVALTAGALRRDSGLVRLSPGAAWAAGLGLAAAVVAVFAAAHPPAAGQLLQALLIGSLLCAAYFARTRVSLGPRAGILADLVVGAAILLLVSDVTVYTAGFQMQPDPSLSGGVLPNWLALHQNSFVGPINDVLHGRVMLVDTDSQYGIADIYALALVFKLVPLGYATFGALTAAALAVQYAVGYATVRLAGVGRLLAAVAMAAAVVSSIFHSAGSPAAFPSLGAQRWLLPFLVVLLGVAEIRRPASRTLPIVGSVLVALSCVWSFEAFAYTAAAWLALNTALAYTGAGGIRAVGRRVLWTAAGCAAAQLLLLAGTVIAAGELPDWAPYLEYLRSYSLGSHDSVLAPSWWPGILVGGIFFASLALVVAAIRWRPSFASRNRPALVAAAGLAAFGAVSFSYAVRFSFDDPLLRNDLAAILLVVLGVHLFGRSSGARQPVARIAVPGAAFVLAALLVIQGWAGLRRQIDRTPLAAAIPGSGGSLRQDLKTVWHNPPIDPRAEEAQRLLDRYWPGSSQALVLLQPDLSVEALMRSGRVNALPVPYFLMDDIAAGQVAPRVRSAIAGIRPGTLMLTERFYLTPGAKRAYVGMTGGPLALERVVLHALRSRFRLVPVRQAPGKLVLVKLKPRRP